MTACPVCGQEEVIFSGQAKYEVEGRPTALCPHTEAHARAGAAARSVRFFMDTGELLGPVKQSPWERLYAAGIPMGIEEEGRRFGAPFLFERCGIRGLSKAAVLLLGSDPELAPLLPSPKVMAAADREGWPLLLAPLYSEAGLSGIELRQFSPQVSLRPGETAPKAPGRIIRTLGQRGVYLTDPFASPRVVVIFEGIWDAVTAAWDAFERESSEFAFGGISANASAAMIRGALAAHFPGVPVVVIGDRDRAGVQAMARLQRVFPTAVLQGVGGPGGPKDYREADPDSRWQALLSGVEAGVEAWDRRQLGGPSDGRPMIVIRPPEHEVVAQAWKALRGREQLFLRGGRLVSLQRGLDGTRTMSAIPSEAPALIEVSLYGLRHELSQAAHFVHETAEGMTRPGLVPEWLPQLMLASAQTSGLPVLNAIVESPVLLPNGEVLTAPGLEEGSGLFYIPNGRKIQVGEHPSLSEARAAADLLLDLVADFPFATHPSPGTHRAAWLAFLLTVFARQAIPGPVPFVLIDANGPGAGKGLIAQLTALIALGRPLPVAVAPKDGEEVKKLVLASLREGHRMFFLDEVPNPFGSREWNGLITAYPNYQGRLLGQSALIQVPQLTLWVVAGNNVALTADVARRCLHIRLEPMVDRPEDRNGFRIPDLLAHAEAQRGDLTCAALTILRAFHVAGRPAFGLTPWGSFGAWSDLVRNAVFWVTGVDCDTRQVLADRADLSRQAWRLVLQALQEAFGPRPFTVEQVMHLCGEDGVTGGIPGLRESLDALHSNPKGLCPKSLGWILLHHERTVSDGRYLERHAMKRQGSRLWIIQAAESAKARAS